MRKRRLGLAGVQKAAEGLITLNTGIKDQVLPALTSMQFEDAVSQRIDHLVKGWKIIDHFIQNHEKTEEADSVASKLAEICSSVEETNDFYTIVLKEDPLKDKKSVLYFLNFNPLILGENMSLITKDLIDRYQSFTEKSLQWCVKESEASTSRVSDAIDQIIVIRHVFSRIKVKNSRNIERSSCPSGGSSLGTMV